MNLRAPNCGIIGPNAFSSCSSLQCLDMEHLATVAVLAFFNCVKLTNISITNVETISQQSFFNAGLRVVNATSATEIGSYAFGDCKELEYVYLNKLEVIAGDFVFANCPKLKVVEARNLLTVDDSAPGIFAGCTSLEVVFFPKSPPRTFNERVFTLTGRKNVSIGKAKVVDITLCLSSYKDYENYESKCDTPPCIPNQWKYLYAKKPQKYAEICHGEDDSDNLGLIFGLISAGVVVVISVVVLVFVIKFKRVRERNSMVEKDMLLSREVIGDFG